MLLSKPSVVGASVGGGLFVQLYVFGLATLKVWPRSLSVVGVGIFVPVLQSTFFCALVTNTRHESSRDVLHQFNAVAV